MTDNNYYYVVPIESILREDIIFLFFPVSRGPLVSSLSFTLAKDLLDFYSIPYRTQAPGPQERSIIVFGHEHIQQARTYVFNQNITKLND